MPAARGVEVWIADRVTGKTVLRVVASEGDPEPDPALALRAVDLLRASLLETVPARAPPRARCRRRRTPRPGWRSPTPVAPASPEASVLRVAVSFGAMGSPGGLGAVGVLDADVAWMPSEHVGAVLFATLPLSRPDVTGAPGSADFAAGLGGMGARFLPTMGAGVCGSRRFTSGSPSSGWRARGAQTRASPRARRSPRRRRPSYAVGLAFAPTPRFRLRADLLGAVLVQAASVQLAAQQFATWGRPVGLFSAGVDFGLF